MNAPALNRDQCREIDRRATDDYGIASIVLMENAGRGCVDVLERLGIDGPVVILCGKGNNAGDGFVIARHLDIRGHACRVFLLCPPQELRGDAATNFAILQKTNVRVVVVAGLASVVAGLPTEPPRGPQVSNASAKNETVGRANAGSGDPRTTAGAASRAALDEQARGTAWLIDALLGTGAVGEPRPPFDAAIDWMNARPTNTKVLAVDVPSGLNCDTGQPAAHTVRADHTCTFAAMKIGFTQPAAKPFTGDIHVCDIGVPLSLIQEVARL
jgi:NAD(P)H-hydrate epimerase